MVNLDAFLEFENTHKLFYLQYEGIYYWQFLRFYISNEIIYGKESESAHPDVCNLPLKKKLGFFPYLLPQVKGFFSGKSYDLFFSYAYIRREIDGKMLNPHIQFIQDDCPFSFKNYTTFSSNWTKAAFADSNNSLIELLWSPIAVFLSLKQKVVRNSIPELEQVIDLLNHQFQCDLLKQKYINMAVKWIKKFKLLNLYFSHTTKRKFKAIVMGCHYDVYHYALVAVARKYGMPTIELQHGTVGKHHVSYNFHDTSKEGKYLPDYLFTYGDYWSETTRLPSYVKPISVGSPLMDYSRSKLRDRLKDQKQVLFVSDGMIGSVMSKLAMQFADISVPKGYKIIYKFHPSERLTWRERYPWLVTSTNIKIEETPINVHELLATSQHIVSIASTVLFEALAFDCNVYIWNKQGCEVAEDFIKKGITPVFNDATELLTVIAQSKTTSNSTIADSLYKPDSLKNIESALATILKQKESDSKQA